MAKDLQTTPSSLLSLTDPLEIYCVNQAVWHFGTTVKGRIDQAMKSTGKHDKPALQEWRAENELRKALGLPQKFATPLPTK